MLSVASRMALEALRGEIVHLLHQLSFSKPPQKRNLSQTLVFSRFLCYAKGTAVRMGDAPAQGLEPMLTPLARIADRHSVRMGDAPAQGLELRRSR